MEIDTTSKFLPPKSLSDAENPVEDQVSTYLCTYVQMVRSILYIYYCTKQKHPGCKKVQGQ